MTQTVEQSETEDYLESSFADAADEAIAGGKTVIVGDESHLLIDYDSKESVKRYWDLRTRLHQMYHIEKEEWWKSGSGLEGHAHLYVTLAAKLSVQERIAIQALCGSDPIREIVSLERHRRGITEPCRLFRPAKAVIEEGWPTFEDDDDLPF